MAAKTTKKADSRVRSLPHKQKAVYSFLQGGLKPPEIAKQMKISVNGVYGHMRRIESHDIDLSAFRSNNGRSGNGRTRSRRPKQAVHDPAIERLLKNLDSDEAALKERAQGHETETKRLETELKQHTEAGVEIENGLLAIEAARKHLNSK
jgi:transposase